MIFQKKLLKEMFGFAGWNTLTSFAIIGRNQGIAIVLNHFWGAVINAARLYGVDPETALSCSSEKFRRRFTYLEEQTLRKGLSFRDLTLAQMDAIWDEAKAQGL